MLHIKAHHAARQLQADMHLPFVRVLLRPFIAQHAHHLIQHDGGHVAGVVLLHAGNVQHIAHDAAQPLHIVLHHAVEFFGQRLIQLFIQQLRGLPDGCQRVANLVRNGGRHAPHGRQFFGAHLALHLLHILQIQQAQRLIVGRGGRYRPYMAMHHQMRG